MIALSNNLDIGIEVSEERFFNQKGRNSPTSIGGGSSLRPIGRFILSIFILFEVMK